MEAQSRQAQNEAGARPFVVAANWKMYKGPREAVSYLKDFTAKAGERPAGCKVIFFVPAIDIWVVQEVLRSTAIGWGAQNSYFEKQGAFTGENSPQILAELQTPYTLVGHSERRALFHESDDMLAKKVTILQQVGIEPMLCVGETLDEREKSQTADVIRGQLQKGLALRDPSKPLMIAYEPVWAIGTGKVATPEQANEAHAILRAELEKIGGPELAKRTPILYGGSVKADNAVELATQPEIDGFLVGGASLEVESFIKIVRTAKSLR